MQASDLRSSVNRVVQLLEKSDVAGAVRDFRAAPKERKAVMAARLGHAGALITAGTDDFSRTDFAVMRALHLDTLATADYWENLLSASGNTREAAAAFVHLHSRVMFATSHLPALLSLLKVVDDKPAVQRVSALKSGEASLTIRLADAGERATDPDRIARSVDGIDMLYSACASIARKPAMDLRLDGINGSVHRDIHFTGDSDSVAAVASVIGSVPAALDTFEDDEDLDLERVVKSLPIFDDLKRLGQLGTFSPGDLGDIIETMHQGVLLALESGVILVEDPAALKGSTSAFSPVDVPRQAGPRQAASRQASKREQPSNADAIGPAPSRGEHSQSLSREFSSSGEQQSSGMPSNPGEADEHYQRYLHERQAMLDNQADGLSAAAMDEQRRRDAVEDLLKNLGRARSQS